MHAPGSPASPQATLALLLWELLAMTGGLAWHFLQDRVAKSAVTALASLYGTKFTYGSIIKTICKWMRGLCGWPWEEAQLAFPGASGQGAQIWGQRGGEWPPAEPYKGSFPHTNSAFFDIFRQTC